MMLLLEGWKLDSRRDFPLSKGRGGGPQTWTKGKDGGSIKNGGGKLFFGGRMRGKGP